MKASRALVAAAGAAVAGGVALRRALQPAEVDFRGRGAIVTGGSRGLGLLISRELVRQGAKVAILARERTELEAAQAELEAAGGQVLALVCDVADRERVEETVQTAIAHFGGVDVLVNNAGVIQVGPLLAMTQADFQLSLDVMFWGVVNPTLALLPHLLQRGGGRIVNITSIGGKVSAPHVLPYSTAKFAAVGFSEGLRAELAPDRIAVTTVVPGLMRTGSFLNAYFKGDQGKEYAWFSLSDNLPLLSMDAEQAAARIVLAARRGEAEVTLTLPARIGARFHGLFPGLTADLLGLVNRVLPPASGPASGMARGAEIQRRLNSPLLERVTSRGQEAARRFNQLVAQPGARNGAES